MASILQGTPPTPNLSLSCFTVSLRQTEALSAALEGDNDSEPQHLSGISKKVGRQRSDEDNYLGIKTFALSEGNGAARVHPCAREVWRLGAPQTSFAAISNSAKPSVAVTVCCWPC